MYCVLALNTLPGGTAKYLYFVFLNILLLVIQKIPFAAEVSLNVCNLHFKLKICKLNATKCIKSVPVQYITIKYKVLISCKK